MKRPVFGLRDWSLQQSCGCVFTALCGAVNQLQCEKQQAIINDTQGREVGWTRSCTAANFRLFELL